MEGNAASAGDGDVQRKLSRAPKNGMKSIANLDSSASHASKKSWEPGLGEVKGQDFTVMACSSA